MSKKAMIEKLQELIRQVDSVVSPLTYDYTLKDLMVQSPQNVFKGDYSKCIIPYKIGSQLLHLPICNRFAMVDPKIIKLSMKMVNKLKSAYPQEEEGRSIILGKLDRLFRRYNKQIPKPANTAAKNGQVTKYANRIINNMRGHLS